MHKKWNNEKERVFLEKAAPCMCGERRAYFKQMTSIDGTEMGVICLKCERFSLGEDLTDSVINWNKRQKGY